MEILCLFHYSPRNYNVPQNTGNVYSVVNCTLIRFCLVLVLIMHGMSFVSENTINQSINQSFGLTTVGRHSGQCWLLQVGMYWCFQIWFPDFLSYYLYCIIECLASKAHLYLNMLIMPRSFLYFVCCIGVFKVYSASLVLIFEINMVNSMGHSLF